MDKRGLQYSRLAFVAGESGVRQEISLGRSHPWRTFKCGNARLARFIWDVESHHRSAFVTRLLRADAESSRKLRSGRGFTRANVKDFGGGDLRDMLAGVDAAIKKHPIDSARLGVTGWSYGGFMTMWTVTQTNRFRAAVAGAGIANWQSYYGQNLIDQWMIPFFGASVYDDPAVYEKSSPIHFITNVKTPTLVIVGERDAECPASQSYEFWHALKTLGVPTQLIIYPGEGHLFIKPENQADRMDKTVGWFDKYLR
ncbi:MAG: hypothetical protein DMF21_12135 [Verrucomicrobia bacterium]|nr:MAG: hypothetical protein DMF21_12135 [Verrucomicrobiota bacterium]